MSDNQKHDMKLLFGKSFLYVNIGRIWRIVTNFRTCGYFFKIIKQASLGRLIFEDY